MPVIVTILFLQTDGYFDKQQGVPGLWDANHQPGAVHEVLSLQCSRAGGRQVPAIAAELQAARRWGAMQKLHTLEAAVSAGVSRGWDTRGGGAVLG